MAANDNYGWGFGLWLLAFVLCGSLLVHAFIRVVQWPFAMSPDRAEAKWPGQIDPSWRAVSPNHGRPQEWPHGTVAGSPSAFAAWLSGLVASAAGVWFCYIRLKWYTEPPERR